MATAALLTLTAISAATSIAGGVAANRDAKAEADQFSLLGRIEAKDKRRESRRLFAAQQVKFAGSGVDPSVGTPLDVLADTVAEAELAALRIQFGRESEAAAIRSRGRRAQTQGITGALGTILGGVSTFGKLGSPPSSSTTSRIPGISI